AAADYISRHFPPSESTNINSSTINVTNDDWSIGTEHWYEEANINAEINAVTTRAQSKLQAQPRSSSANTSPTSQSTCSSPPMTTPLHDFSLSRIRSEQAQT
ncbi:unnamed protein product, partial [Rotaria sp. Silwood2]